VDRDFSGLPDGDLVSKGLSDLEMGDQTEEALLVLIARPRLRGLGISIPLPTVDVPEHALYSAIEERCPDGDHAAYNALIQRIVSFANAYSFR
jgi:hypothetical protein